MALLKDGKLFAKVFRDSTVFVSTVLANRRWWLVHTFIHVLVKCLSAMPSITCIAQVPLKFIDCTMLIYKRWLFLLCFKNLLFKIKLKTWICKWAILSRRQILMNWMSTKSVNLAHLHLCMVQLLYQLQNCDPYFQTSNRKDNIVQHMGIASELQHLIPCLKNHMKIWDPKIMIHCIASHELDIWQISMKTRGCRGPRSMSQMDQVSFFVPCLVQVGGYPQTL